MADLLALHGGPAPVESPRRFGRHEFEIPQPSRNTGRNGAALEDAGIPKCVGSVGVICGGGALIC